MRHNSSMSVTLHRQPAIESPTFALAKEIALAPAASRPEYEPQFMRMLRDGPLHDAIVARGLYLIHVDLRTTTWIQATNTVEQMFLFYSKFRQALSIDSNGTVTLEDAEVLPAQPLPAAAYVDLT